MEAHFENRIYFFDVKSKTKNEVIIEMYHMQYIFIKGDDGKWSNNDKNRLKMRQELLEVIVGQTV